MNLAYIRTKHFPGLTAKQVNIRHDWRWAIEVHKAYPHAKLCSNKITFWPRENSCGAGAERSHSFVKLGELFYDVQKPLGVLNVGDLPFFKSWPYGLQITEFDIKDFIMNHSK